MAVPDPAGGVRRARATSASRRTSRSYGRRTTTTASACTTSRARDREAEVWVAASTTHAVGLVTFCPPGSPWREIGREDEGEFRMLAVDPAAQGIRRRRGPRAAVRGARPPGRRHRDGPVVAGDHGRRAPDLRAAGLRPCTRS